MEKKKKMKISQQLIQRRSQAPKDLLGIRSKIAFVQIISE